MIAEFRTAASALMSRMRWANLAGITFGGARDLYQILGYRRQLGYWDYRDRYARDGVAKAVVDAYPDATWRGGVEVFEDEDPEIDTAFELAFKDLDKRLGEQSGSGFWQTCHQVDILAGLSTFAVLLIGVSGGSDLTTELPKGQRLLFLKPFSGGGGEQANRRNDAMYDAAARVARYEIDPTNERFGEPASYYIRSQTPGSTFLNFEVHWSRVIHVAEGCLEDNVFGIPTLEAVFNLFDDLAKITGGGSEAFWLRANQGLHLDVDAQMGLPGTNTTGLTPTEREALKDKAEELQHQLQRVLVTRGVTATQLGSDVAQFGPSGEFILKLIAGTARIPQRILTGSEMGTLASEQDAANFDSRVQDRRTGYAGPKIVRRTLDRLIKYGYLPTPVQYEIGWPVEENMDEKGKAAYAVSLASVNQTQGEVVFTSEEIRDMAFDLEPLTDAQKKAIADAAAEKVAQAQEAMVPAEKEPEMKAALRALERAIEDDDLEAIGELLALGDVEGHEFHGNQHTGGIGSITSHETKNTMGGWQSTVEFDSGHIVEYGKVKGVTASQHTGYQIRMTLPDKLTTKEWKYSTKGLGAGQQEKMEKQLAKLGIAAPYRSGLKALTDGPHTYATTQIQLDAAATESLLMLGRAIPDADLAEKGRETDAHITVKYGLITPSREKLQGVLAYRGAVTGTFGQTAVFESADYDVVYVPVDSPSLVALNKAITNLVECAPSDHPYQPHATVAYVKSGAGRKYVGLTALEGMSFSDDTVVLVQADGTRSEVALA